MDAGGRQVTAGLEARNSTAHSTAAASAACSCWFPLGPPIPWWGGKVLNVPDGHWTYSGSTSQLRKLELEKWIFSNGLHVNLPDLCPGRRYCLYCTGLQTNQSFARGEGRGWHHDTISICQGCWCYKHIWKDSWCLPSWDMQKHERPVERTGSPHRHVLHLGSAQ